MNARVIILHDVIAEAADTRDLPEPGGGASREFEAQVVLLEQPVMELMAYREVDRGAALRIDGSGAVWLGEVEECLVSGEGFSIRVRLRHVLRDFETLARLAERFGAGAVKDIPVEI